MKVSNKNSQHINKEKSLSMSLDTPTKILKVKSSNFKNSKEILEINFIAQSKKTPEDKEYELQEIDKELFVYNTMAFIGKNASGKTTAIELLDCAYNIVNTFRLEGKHYDYSDINLTIHFYKNGWIYKYDTILQNANGLANKANFTQQHLYKKKYYKSKLNNIYDDTDFMPEKDIGNLPEDTSIVFFVNSQKASPAVYFDSFGEGTDTYKMLFKTITTYKLDKSILFNIFKIFDNNISKLDMLDDHNYVLTYNNHEKYISDKELFYFLSSGTTKGILLYTLVAASLKNGFDLLIDEIENHFHKTLVENLLSLYKDKSVNRKNATLIFTTHYCELLDLFNRRDNIWICKNESGVILENMYDKYDIRNEILKSRQFYKNTFNTAVNYDELMNLKRSLMQ